MGGSSMDSIRILLKSMNNHRNNNQAVSLMRVALLELGHTVVEDIRADYDLAMIWGVTADIAKIKSKVLYMDVDRDIIIPDNVSVISQFTDTRHYYYPISALAVFHELWDNPLIHDKTGDSIYGGTYKDRRDYSNIKRDTLIAGNDKRWEDISDSVVPKYNNLTTWYEIMAGYKFTYIVYDEYYTGVCNTTRLYECVFTRVDAVMEDGSIYKHEAIKRSVTKLEMLQLTKQLIKANYE